MTTCTVFDSPPGPGDPAIVAALGVQCDLPADYAVRVICACGHPGVSLQCEGHAEIAQDEGFCLDCAAAGHRCPLEIKAREIIP
jgi:hypothetical protein